MLYVNVNTDLMGFLPKFQHNSPLKRLGPLPSSLGNLTKLTYLDLCRSNAFSGGLPSSLINLTELHWLALDLSNNGLTGGIPHWLLNLTQLNLLDLSGNQLEGPIFSSRISQLENLDLLLLDNNRNLHGDFDAFLKLKYLRVLSLVGVKLTFLGKNTANESVPKLNRLSPNSCNLREFPQFLRSLMNYFDASNNELSGGIPDCMSELSNALIILNLERNNLHGNIPATYPESCNLRWINLNGNRLEGSMPRSLANCKNLEVLDVGHNDINDTFPSWLGGLSKLHILILRHNHFHGILGYPKVGHDFLSLHIIDLSNNFHTGDLPLAYLQNWDAMKHANESESIAFGARVEIHIRMSGIIQVLTPKYNYSITIANKGNDIFFFPQASYSCSNQDRLALLLQFQQSFIINCAVSNLSTAYPVVNSWGSEPHRGDCFCGTASAVMRRQAVSLSSMSVAAAPTGPSLLTAPCSTLTISNTLASGFMTEFCYCENLLLVPAVLLVNSILPSYSCHDHERSALLQFKHSFIIDCAASFSPAAYPKLVSLHLSDSAFNGQIPLAISNFSSLSTLDLSNQYGDAKAGSQLKLQDLSLEKLLRNLTRLKELYLDQVDISSSVQDILTNLTLLEVVSLKVCNLNDLIGFLPKFQPNSPLKRLGLSVTSFYGELPSSIGELANLEDLYLYECLFSGPLPSSLGNLTKLTSLDLSGSNAFSGDLPSSLINLTELHWLGLSHLQGRHEALISWFFNLNKLTSLYLDFFNLGGEIPSVISNLTSLTVLDLLNNGLTGAIPHWLMNLTQLNVLILSGNQLEGPIFSPGISQLENLNHLLLNNNHNLHGDFDAFLKLKYLRDLNLVGVKLTFLGKNTANESVPKLNMLNLNSCNLGEFPQFLRSQDALEELDLGNNSIHGFIPRWFMNITQETLYSLSLSNNLLTGFE
ncbi:hypothetical protein Cgig2_004029 [Carnegiea gigantea]|uniref:Uncharacterized protein n=1 Tax=Carnegiea gigantea TaxID=171969 RepID=A0A9Q1KU52_9CARY|nr:hypothetical protein Cgig2_004029 [Carnegiea gigantea]